LAERDRLAVHADGVDLGPSDAHDWLCGFVYTDPTPAKQRQLRPLAKRIEQFEPAALDLLQPRDAVQDASAREDSDGEGIALETLGRHSGAARWAIRAAAVRGWHAQREDVPTRKERRERLKALDTATQTLLETLDRLGPRDRAALQAAGLKGGSKMLPAHPELDGQGWLATALQSLKDSVARDLARLGPASDGDWAQDWSAGNPSGYNDTAIIASEALMIWMHFRPCRRPTSAENGPFDRFVRILCEMATDKPKYVRRSVRAVLKEYEQPIAARYPKSVRGMRSPVE
jgi:hypothetical protein